MKDQPCLDTMVTREEKPISTSGSPNVREASTCIEKKRLDEEEIETASTLNILCGENQVNPTVGNHKSDIGGKDDCTIEAEQFIDTPALGDDGQGEQKVEVDWKSISMGRINRDPSSVKGGEKNEALMLEKTEGNSASSTASPTSDGWHSPEASVIEGAHGAEPENQHLGANPFACVAPTPGLPKGEQIDDTDTRGNATQQLQGLGVIPNTQNKGQATKEGHNVADILRQAVKENHHAKSSKEKSGGRCVYMDEKSPKQSLESESRKSVEASGDSDICWSEKAQAEEPPKTMMCASKIVESQRLIQDSPSEQACDTEGSNVEQAEEGESTMDVAQEGTAAPDLGANPEPAFKMRRDDERFDDLCSLLEAETPSKEELAKASSTVRTICERFEHSNFNARDIDLEKFYMNQRAQSVTYQRKKKEAFGLYHGAEEILGNTLGEVDRSSWKSSELGVVQSLGLAIQASSSQHGDDAIFLMVNSTNASSQNAKLLAEDASSGCGQGLTEGGNRIKADMTPNEAQDGTPCDSAKGCDDAGGEKEALDRIDEACVCPPAASAVKSMLSRPTDQSHKDISLQLNSAIKTADCFKKEALGQVDAIGPPKLDLNLNMKREVDQDKEADLHTMVESFLDLIGNGEHKESKGDKPREDQESPTESSHIVMSEDGKGIGSSECNMLSTGEAESDTLRAVDGPAGTASNPKERSKEKDTTDQNPNNSESLPKDLPTRLECGYASASEEGTTDQVRSVGGPELGKDDPAAIDLLSHIRDVWGNNVDRLKEIPTLLNFLSSRDVPLLEGAKVIQLKKELELVRQHRHCDGHLKNDAGNDLLGQLFAMKAFLRGDDKLFESMKKLQTLHRATAIGRMTALEDEPLIEEVMSDLDTVISDLELHIHLLTGNSKQDETRKAKTSTSQKIEKQMQEERQVDPDGEGCESHQLTDHSLEGRRTIHGGDVYPASHWEMLDENPACRLRNKIVLADQEEVEVVAVILKIHDKQHPSAFDSSLCVLNNEKPSSMRRNRGAEHTKKLKVKFLLRSESNSSHTYTSSESTLAALGGDDALCCCLACFIS